MGTCDSMFADTIPIMIVFYMLRFIYILFDYRKNKNMHNASFAFKKELSVKRLKYHLYL